MKRKRAEGNAEFDWDLPPPEPLVQAPAPVVAQLGAVLDSEGHLWWAAFCRAGQERCIGLANQYQEPKLMGELAQIAGSWKALAAEHEAKGRVRG